MMPDTVGSTGIFSHHIPSNSKLEAINPLYVVEVVTHTLSYRSAQIGTTPLNTREMIVKKSFSVPIIVLKII